MTEEFKLKLRSVNDRLWENMREKQDLSQELAALQKQCPHERTSEPGGGLKHCHDCGLSWTESTTPGGLTEIKPQRRR